MSVRASALNEAELCGLAPAISAQRNASGRKALMGTAFHAGSDSPGSKETAAKLARLTPEEREEIAAWKPVESWVDEDGCALQYKNATKEEPIGLGANGCYLAVVKTIDGSYACPVGELLVPATPDMYWVVDGPNGKTVYVGDIKTGEHPIPGGALSLQFVAPALALADKHGADWIRTGIWWARDGRWEWSKEPIAVDSELAVQLWTRIRSAATNPPQAVTGPHCSDCWQRAHCPAFVLPVSQAQTELALLTKPGGLAEATPDQLLKVFQLNQAMKKLSETVADTLKAELRERGAIDVGGGKVLTLQQMAGREYGDVGLLKADGLTKYIKTSKASEFPALRKA